ncbi:MAG: EF-hand domain-containing protein [Acidobacteriota bacterium]
MVRRIVLTLCLVAACKSDKPADTSAPAAPPGLPPAVDMSPADRQARRLERLEAMKKRLDTNGDGKLTVDELKAASGRMHFDDAAAVDTDHDGEISIDELAAAMRARRAQMRGKWGSGAMAGAADEGSAD